MKFCSSCNRQVTIEYIEFKCPKCGDENIIRCDHCRTTSKQYKCSKCEFEGP